MVHRIYHPSTAVIKTRDVSMPVPVGLVVDAVSDVYNVPEEAIKPAPDFGSVVDVNFVQGLATLENAMVIILDIDRLLNADEMAAVEKVAN